MEKHYTIQEVADMLGVTTDAVYKNKARGNIETVKKYGVTVISQSALDRFIANPPKVGQPRKVGKANRTE